MIGFSYQDAEDRVKAAGRVIHTVQSWKALLERVRVAEALQRAAEDRERSAECWARDSLTEERRLRERLTYVYGVARAHGATVEELRQDPDPREGWVPFGTHANFRCAKVEFHPLLGEDGLPDWERLTAKSCEDGCTCPPPEETND